MMKKILIPFYILIAGLVIWGFINPDGIRGAWANNVWSLNFTQQYFSTIKTSIPHLSPPPNHAHSELFQAKLALKQENYTLALNYITPLLTNSDPVVQSLYADLLYRTKEYHGAFIIWQQAGDISSLTKAATEARENNQPDLVILAYTSLYAINPEIYTRPLASELIGNQDYQNAITILDRSIDAYPQSSEHATWLAQIGSTYHTLGLWSEAKSAYQQAVLENPEDWYSWRYLGWIYFDHFNNAEQAISCFEKVINIVPDQNTGYDDIGSILRKEGDLTRALDWYKKNSIEKPDNLNLRMTYADLLRQNNELDRAIEIYQGVISQFPEDDNAYYEIAWTYWISDQPTLAIQSVEEALKISPSKLHFLLRAGNFYESIGLVDDARRYYNRILEIDADNVDAQQGVSRLSGSN